MQATKQSRFNIPGGGWIVIEQDGENLKIETEGRAAGLLAAQIKNRGMDFGNAVSHCKYCLKSEKEILQETIEQQTDFVNFCNTQIALIGNSNLDVRNQYDQLCSSAQYEVRLAQRRLKNIK
jgi:hypothetical protein